MIEDSSRRRRSYRRVKLSTRIDIEIEGFPGFVSGHTTVVSEGGAFILADNPWPPGTSFRFGMRPCQGVRPVRGVAEVVWVRRFAEGRERPAGMGVRFSEIDPEDREIFCSLIVAGSGADNGRAADDFTAEEMDLEDTWTDPGPPPREEAERSSDELESTLVLPDPAPLEDAPVSAAPEEQVQHPDEGPTAELPFAGAVREEPAPVPIARTPVATQPIPAEEYRRLGKRTGSWLAAAAVIVLVVAAAVILTVTWIVGGGSQSVKDAKGGDAGGPSDVKPVVVASEEEDDLWGARTSTKMVQEIWCTESEAATVVVIQGSEPFSADEMKCGRLTDPPRFVIQLFGMTEPYPSESIPADVPGLQGIRVGHHKSGALLETRIVLDLSSAATRVVEPLIQENTILVEVQDVQSARVPPTATVESMPPAGSAATITGGGAQPVTTKSPR